MKKRGAAKGKTYEAIRTGDRAVFDVLVDEKTHASFAKLFQDVSPIHMNENFSEKTRFGGRIGYAFYLTGLLSRLYGMHLPGGTSVCVQQESNFVRPFYIGDKIRVMAKVVRKSDATRFVEIEAEMYRNRSELIFRGLGIVQVLFGGASSRTKLFRFKKQAISDKDFLTAIRKAGVRRGDLVFVHGDIGVFGRLETNDRGSVLGPIVSTLKSAVGPRGGIVMPTFTYSFCRGEDFDVNETPSTTGALSEYFRRLIDVSRTAHPIFSAAIWGKQKRNLLRTGGDCFGPDSIFGKLKHLDGKILFLGAPFQSCTFVHHAEQIHGVPYRYMKTFSGNVILNGRRRRVKSTYYVRDLKQKLDFDGGKLESHLIRRKLLRRTRLGAGMIMSIDARALFHEIRKLLAQDPYFLVRRPHDD